MACCTTPPPGTTSPWLRSITRLPVLLKGVLHPADARAGRGGGGGSGDRFRPRRAHARHRPAHRRGPAPVLAQAVAGAVPVLVDGGIRRGTDVLKAMALGASAVLVGRPAVHGLAHAGALRAWPMCCACCVTSWRWPWP